MELLPLVASRAQRSKPKRKVGSPIPGPQGGISPRNRAREAFPSTKNTLVGSEILCEHPAQILLKLRSSTPYLRAIKLVVLRRIGTEKGGCQDDALVAEPGLLRLLSANQITSGHKSPCLFGL